MPINFGFITSESIMLPSIKGQCIVGMKVWRNGVPSHLFHFFNNFLPEVYSDGCGGQNKNSTNIHFLNSHVALKNVLKKYTIYSPFVVIASCLVIVTLHLSNSGIVKLKLFEDSRVHNKFDVVRVTNKDIFKV